MVKNVQKISIPVLMCRTPGLHVAWVQVTAGLEFFLHTSHLSDSKDRDFLL